MPISRLSEKEQRSLESIGDLGDDDLYAMLGAEPIYYQPSSSADSLLIGLRLEKTRGAITRGKKRLRQLIDTIRDPICERWDSLKKRKTPLDKNALTAIICDVIRRFLNIDPSYPVVPAAILICRACAYSLDSFCKKKITKKT